MMNKKQIIIKYFISSLAIAMISVFWAFCMDAIMYGTWRFFKVVFSIMLYAFIFCMIQFFINYYLDDRPVISMILEYITIILLFFVFGVKFGWYPKGMEWLAIIYTIPVYVVCYILRLAGARRDADYINKKLKELKEKKYNN